MIKLCSIILLLAFCLPTANAQNRIGLVGGGSYARSNLTNQKQSGIIQSSTTFGNIYSFFGGIVYDIKVTDQFSIKSKLLYTNKGWTETRDQRRDSIVNISTLVIGPNNIPVEYVRSKETLELSYLELPVNFTFYTPIGKSLLAIGVGPYLSFGLAGKYNFKPLNSSKYIQSYKDTSYTNADGRPQTERIPIIKDTSNYLADLSAPIQFKGNTNRKVIYNASQFDYGASIEASLEFRFGLSINATYTLGVTNVIEERYGSIQNRHRVVMLGAGYYFRNKRKRG